MAETNQGVRAMSEEIEIDGGADPAASAAERRRRSEVIVKDHALYSLGGGILPLPLLDVAATLAIQLTMIGRLCKLYGVPFSRQAARAIVMTLIGSLGAAGIARGLFWSGVKIVPGLGSLVGVVAAPVSLAAITWALGKMFIGHFETGGTLLDFNADASRGYFRDLVQRGRETVSAWSPGAPAAARAGASS
jgi:uncharacterized protein (DUF697 family)